MSSEFVIHLHVGFGREHYDLMLQRAGVLATWRFDICPVEIDANGELPCSKIQDHRLAYLGYQGEVSGGRGSVTRIDCGTLSLICNDENRWEFIMEGKIISGTFRMIRSDGNDDSWIFERGAKSHTP